MHNHITFKIIIIIFFVINISKFKNFRYFYAICGNPLDMRFSSSTGEFKFKFVSEMCLNNKNSEFYLGEQFYYENGFNYEIEGCDDNNNSI